MVWAAHDAFAIGHAVIASLVTLFLVPSAILTGRLFRTNPLWFRIHVLLNTLTVLLIALVFGLGIASVATADEGTQFSGPDSDLHHKVGLAVFLLVMLQAGLGVYAHMKPSGNQRVMKGGVVRDAKDAEQDNEKRKTKGPTRRCCSDADGKGNCSCAMSPLAGRGCTCNHALEDAEISGTASGTISDLRPTEISPPSETLIPFDSDPSPSFREKKHPIRYLHMFLGLVTAAGLYWLTWEGMHNEWPEMSISMTSAPQSVQFLFWALFLGPVVVWLGDVGNKSLEALGRKLARMDYERISVGRDE